jgi:hypothetical protein
MVAGIQMTRAEQIAETFGVVLGAASQCEQVSEERLSAVAVKARDAVITSANDAADAEAAEALFSAAVEAGRAAAERGKVDPDSVESAFGEMEQQLSV